MTNNNIENNKLQTWDQYALKIENWSGKLSTLSSIASSTNKAIVYAEENLSYLVYIGGPLITVLSNIPDLNLYKEYIPVHLMTITGIAIATAPYLKEAAMAARVLIFGAKLGRKISNSIITNTNPKPDTQQIIAQQEETNNRSKPEYLKTLSHIGYACSYGDLLSRGASNTLNYLEPIINYHLIEDTTAISSSLALANSAFNKLKYVGTIPTTICAINTAQDMFNSCKSITNAVLSYKTFFVTYMLQDSLPKYELKTKKPIIFQPTKSQPNNKQKRRRRKINKN